MAKGYEKYLQRVGHTTGRMSKHLPKPNVCRIEVMDSAARRSYMGGFQGELDKFKEVMYERIAQDRYDLYEPFYGILDNASSGSGPSFTVNATWSGNKNNKSGFARMSSIVTGSGGKSGLFGRIPLMSGLNTGANALANTIEEIAKAGMRLSGVNNSCTGSMTIKDFSGATIEASLPLKFQWYLPEQEDMCRMSLRRLIMMAYVRPMDKDGFEVVNAMIEGMMKVGNDLQPVFDQVVQDVKDLPGNVIDFFNGGSAVEQERAAREQEAKFKDGNNSNGSNNPGVLSTILNKAKPFIATGMDVYNSINTYFGGEITANPLPVRVSIGHYMDLEPMVINSVKISSSQEQFISSDGTHLPIFINADVSVSYWMQPGPTKDFISILGNEVFEPFVDRKTQKIQGAGNGNGNKKTGGSKKNKSNPNRKKKRR